MLTRPIPRSGERVPVVGLGTWQTFDISRGVLHESGELIELLRQFRALGASLIDSSPMYGNAEAVVGEGAELAGVASDLFVATKVWTRGEQEGIRQMSDSMRLLRRDVIDLVQVHNLLDWRTHLTTLRRWKSEGRVRYIGITHYTPTAYPELESVLAREDIDFVQLAYSPGERSAERSLLPRAMDRGVAVLINRPFEEGAALRRLRDTPLPPDIAEYASSWAEANLKFIIAHRAVTCVIPATRSLKHLRENLAAGDGRLPSETERERLARLMR